MTMFIGLDGEMSDNDIDTGAALIQIGFAVYRGDGLVANFSTLNPMEPNLPLNWSKEAAAVHNIPLNDVLSASPKYDVDVKMWEWLVSVAGVDSKSRMNNVPVGWNVAGFDMPYVKKYLPKTYSLFSRRTVDLNAVCFALDSKDGKSAEWWKDASKAYAEDVNPPTEGYGPHNAGWDAIMSINCFNFLSNAIRGVVYF